MSRQSALRSVLLATLALAAVMAAWASLPRRTVSGDEAPVDVRVIDRASSQAPAVPGELIVKFRQPLLARDMGVVVAGQGATLRRELRLERHALVEVPPGQEEKVANRLANLPFVESVERNIIYKLDFVPNDTYYSYQWSFPQIDTPSAWDVSTGSGVVVAVVDSGVAYEDCSPATCGATYAQAPDLAGTSFAAGYDFGEDDAHPNDRMGHGTHVTGTIAQTTDNGLGVAGVAFDATVMPVKISDDYGTLPLDAVVDGIVWAADNGAQVMNMSFGGGPATSLEDAINYALGQGVVLVAAAGNGGGDGIGDPTLDCPACYPGVIAVGATRYDQTRSSYSNYGTGRDGHTLDLVAPGGDTTVDQNGDGYGDGVLQQTYSHFCDPEQPEDYTSFVYCFADGTSMATPHVAGVAALILAANPSLTMDEVKDVLTSTATDLGTPGYDLEYGYGLVDAYAAVLAANDFDLDGVPNAEDNCPNDYNPDQMNTDGQRRPNGSQISGDWASNPSQDKLGDACDPDDDNDGLPDSQEFDGHCPYRLIADSDGDTVPDGYEINQGKDACSAASKPACTSTTDSDGDGFSDCLEHSGYNTCAFAGDTTPGYTTCANPTDSDGDGCADWIEIVDVNGSRQANIVDVLAFAQRAFDVIPASDSDYVLDINKSGAVNIVDVLLAAWNSNLLRPHSTCLPE
jgi:serine protease